MSIVANALNYSHPDRQVVFQSLNLSIATGQKTSLVGNNGVGKSTLLQVLAGILKHSSGDIALETFPYYLPQQFGAYNNCSVAEVLGIAGKLAALQAITAGSVDEAHFTTLADNWDIEERALAALSHWQLPKVMLSQTEATLSGGEKTRVFLAGMQLHEPEVILLDEPTNHLDAAGRQLLYSFIESSKATILIVSHDRTLLNLVNQTLELSRTGIQVFGGNYNFYETQKAGKLNALQAQLNEQEKTLKHAQQKAREVAEQRQKKEARGNAHGEKLGLARIASGARKSNAQQSSVRVNSQHAEKLDGIKDNLKELREQVQDYQPLKVDLKASVVHTGKLLAEAQGVNIIYNNRVLWQQPLNFQLRAGERIWLKGNNGSGKTTLVKLLTGKLSPSTGHITLAPFSYLYIDQEYSSIDNSLTVFQQVESYNSRLLPQHDVKMLLAYHQFPQGSWDKPCAALSGGEKLKLLLCCQAVSNNMPDVLILDEPTNNLDIASQQILTQAVKAFTGTVLIISHDIWFAGKIGVSKEICLV